MARSNSEKIIYIDLGYIGDSAEKLQSLFSGYSKEPNEHGFFLNFIGYSHLANNIGVRIETNCFQSKKQFMETLMLKLLSSL